MPIVGFKLKEIEANVGEEKRGEVKVVISPPVISEVKKKKVVLEGIGEVISFEFEFGIRYEPINGRVLIKGEVLYDGKDKKDILKNWEKEKKIDNKIILPILNFIFRKCVIKALALADDLQLPPPLRLPEIIEGKK